MLDDLKEGFQHVVEEYVSVILYTFLLFVLYFILEALQAFLRSVEVPSTTELAIVLLKTSIPIITILYGLSDLTGYFEFGYKNPFRAAVFMIVGSILLAYTIKVQNSLLSEALSDYTVEVAFVATGSIIVSILILLRNHINTES
ncbi:MAG: hypothetical protein QXO98_02870 [Sulfolobales archaeon]